MSKRGGQITVIERMHNRIISMYSSMETTMALLKNVNIMISIHQLSHVMIKILKMVKIMPLMILETVRIFNTCYNIIVKTLNPLRIVRNTML